MTKPEQSTQDQAEQDNKLPERMIPSIALDEQAGPLDEPAGEWFVNRKTELDIFWKWASGIPHGGRNSYALIGLRRTGKSAILHKTFNRLFRQQSSILPVYISFGGYLHRQKPLDAYEFVDTFIGDYVRCYLAFRYHKIELFAQDSDLATFEELANQYQDEALLSLFTHYKSARYGKLSSAFQLMRWAISVPSGLAKQYKIPTALIIDEFQVLTSVYNPDSHDYNDVTNGFQKAAESRWAPLLVSGSSVSMMVGEALGGMLAGRFKVRRLRPLAQEHAIDMIYRLGKYHGIEITEALAVAIYAATQGYPYSIECLLNSDSPALERLPDVDALTEIITFELTQEAGALWEFYEGEFGKYVRQLNGDQTTRKILYWIANHPSELIRPDKVAEVFGLEWQQVQDSLEKLYKIDVIERAAMATYQGPSDPLLREFLKFEHNIYVDNWVREDAVATLRQQLNAKQGEINRQAGHFTEIIVAGVLNNYDERSVDGATYFGIATPILLPRMEKIVRRAGVLKDGELHEIDVIGEHRLYNGRDGNSGLGAWLVSVRYRGKKMGEGDVAEFIQHAAALQAERQYGQITRWYVSKGGFTQAALQQMNVAGIYASDLTQFNALSSLFGLLPLAM